MKKYWFKAKYYGWGWYPSSWQGGLVMLIFILLIIFNAIRIDSQQHSVSNFLINFIPQTILFAIILIIIAWQTGEMPKWRWGKS
jgi:hypothetical protein